MPFTGPGGGLNPAMLLFEFMLGLGDRDMAIRGVSITLQYLAFNVSTGAYVTGDVANHTLRWIKDGVSAAPTNAAAEVDATNAPGAYKVTLVAAEMTCDTGMLHGKSSTANVIIIPVQVTTEHGVLPTVQQGNNGAVMTSGTNIGPWTVQSSTGNAVTFNSTFAGGHGLYCSGNGNGAGIWAAGGTTGPGCEMQGGGGAFVVSSGVGLSIQGAIAASSPAVNIRSYSSS